MTERLSGSTEVAVVTRLFDAVSAWDLGALLRCYHPEVTIHECSDLPYGGTYRGLAGAMEHARAFSGVWSPFWDRSRPVARSLVSDGEGTTTVRFRHHAHSITSGRTLDEPKVGVYKVLDGLVVRAQMFHFEPQALRRFLDAEGPPATPPGWPEPG